ncbi:MAG: hypothetical protein QG656_1432, partial [Candidatus Hydrogenedentes bacterium]|nr:hypothetical protein [Candidatus Hydrogenedentota bacterium]
MEFDNFWADVLLNLIQYLRHSPSGRRGAAYAEDGQVLQIGLDDPYTLFGVVSGSKKRPYRVQIQVQGKYMTTICTCPVEYHCKHAVALAYTLLGEAFRRGSIAVGAEQLLIPPTLRNRSPRLTLALSPEIEALLGDPIADAFPKKKDGRPWWIRFIEAGTSDDRRKALVEGVRERVPDMRSMWHLDSLIDELLRLDNPIEALCLFDAKIGIAVRYAGYRVMPPNPERVQFLESEEALRIYADCVRRAADTRLVQWLEEEQKPRAGDHVYVEVVWTTQAESFKIPELAFCILLTTKRLRRDRRSYQQIQSLQREVESGSRALNKDEARLLDWITSKAFNDLTHHLGAYGRYDSDLNSFPVYNALSWLTLWGMKDAIRWENGGAVRFCPESARLTFARNEQGGLYWAVTHADDHGQTVTSPLATLSIVAEAASETNYTNKITRRELFVRIGDSLHRLETGGMPSSLVESLRYAHEVPVERLRNTAAGAALVNKLYPTEAQRVEQDLVEIVPVQPVLEWRYDAERGRLAVTCRAETGHAAIFYRDHRGHWGPGPKEWGQAKRSADAMQPMGQEEVMP